MTEYLRTPEENFADLPNLPYAPHFHRWQDLRMHSVDEGPADGPVMLLLHGMPTWSFLYRHMIPVPSALPEASLDVLSSGNRGWLCGGGAEFNSLAEVVTSA